MNCLLLEPNPTAAHFPPHFVLGADQSWHSCDSYFIATELCLRATGISAPSLSEPFDKRQETRVTHTRKQKPAARKRLMESRVPASTRQCATDSDLGLFKFSWNPMLS